MNSLNKRYNKPRRIPYPIWTLFLSYFREKQIGEEFKISEIYTNIGLNEKDRKNTIYKYRTILEDCGYIKRIEGITFKKIKAIPKMTKQVAMDKAFGHSWKSWFLEEVDPK
jgi:hypothetical protein